MSAELLFDPPRRGRSKWWRPKWSIRLLLVVVTLTSCYLAGWRVTYLRGIDDVETMLGRRSGEVVSPAPFLILAHERVFREPEMRTVLGVNREANYYFWFFGNVQTLRVAR